MTDPFHGVIGQEGAIEELRFHLAAQRLGESLPTFALISPKGCGKTMLAKRMRDYLAEVDGREAPHIINCATLGSVADFVEKWLKPRLESSFTLIFDEASELPSPVSMFLLSLLEPNNDGSNSVIYNGMAGEEIIEVEFSRHTFIFATSEPHKVFHALMDRCERIELTEYKKDEVKQILALQPRVNVASDILEEIADICRGNARECVKWGEKIVKQQIINQTGRFRRSDWVSFKRRFKIMPLGLTANEVKLLEVLAKRPQGTSLTRLAACLGSTPISVQKDYELYPQKMDLMSIDKHGRKLTEEGKKYLTKLRASIKVTP